MRVRAGIVAASVIAMVPLACGDEAGTASNAGSGGGGNAAATGGAAGGGGSGGTAAGPSLGGTGGAACPGTQKTTVSGTVYAPTLVSPDPIPNVAVYVSSGTLAPFPPGVACVKCGDESPSITADQSPRRLGA